MEKKKREASLKVLRTGDERSQFNYSTAKEILESIGRPKYLLSSSSKIRKGEKIGVLTKVLYLTSGLFCPGASRGCLATCLGHSSGFMKVQRATDARDRRSALYVEDREAFIGMLKMELHEHRYNAETQGLLPAIRLNGTSDLRWEVEHRELFEEFSDIIFYDYTKLFQRMGKFLFPAGFPAPEQEQWPENYHLTFSLSERNAHHAERVLEWGGNVATVFAGDLPSTWMGYPVIDGDRSDARFLDPSPKRRGGPVIVGLSAKGYVAQDRDRSGFVVRPDSQGQLRIANNAA